MKILRLYYTIPFMCRMLNLSSSGYSIVSLHDVLKEETRLEVEIKAAHKRTRETFGPERLQYDLAAHGIKVGICRIRKKLGIRCKQIKKFKVTTDSKHKLPVAENLLSASQQLHPAECGSATSPTSLPKKAGSILQATKISLPVRLSDMQ